VTPPRLDALGGTDLYPLTEMSLWMRREGDSALPAELETWVDSRAAEEGLSRSEVVARALAAYRYLADADVDAEVADAEEQRRLAERVDALDDRLDDQVDDVRERVVEVLRTAESKAPEDHDHPELAESLDAVADRVEELSADVAAVDDDLDALSDRLDGGFDNYESILTTLRDRTEDLDEQSRRLAELVDGLDGRLSELEADAAADEAVDELKRTANAEGVDAAACENCGNRVRIGLLAEPNCPHCEAPLADVEPGRRFFGSATLTTANRPALTADGDGGADDPPSPLSDTADVDPAGPDGGAD